MKRFFLLSLLLVQVSLFARDGYTVNYNQASNGTVQLEFALDDYGVNTVAYQGTSYSQVSFEGRITTGKKGFAELPYLSATVMLDPLKNVSLEVIPGSTRKSSCHIQWSHHGVPSIVPRIHRQYPISLIRNP